MATQVVFQQPSKGEAQEVPSTSRALSATLYWQPGVNLNPPIYGGSVGAFATIACELRQVRKEATAASDSGAGVSLAELPPSLLKQRPARHSAAGGSIAERRAYQ